MPSIRKHNLKHGTFTLLSLCILTGCLCHRTLVNAPDPPQVDSIIRISVDQGKDSLARGLPVHMLVRVQYTLATYDTGFLSLTLDQFPNTQSCIPQAGQEVSRIDVPGSPGNLAPIVRGTHTLEIPVTWPGDTGQGTDGHVMGSGAISFEGSLWSDHPRYRFLTRAFGTQYCVRF